VDWKRITPQLSKLATKTDVIVAITPQHTALKTKIQIKHTLRRSHLSIILRKILKLLYPIMEDLWDEHDGVTWLLRTIMNTGREKTKKGGRGVKQMLKIP
jgi:hypothetical protein